MSHALPDTPRTSRSLEVLAAALFGLYACAQLAQQVILSHAPPDSDTAASFAFALSFADRLRAGMLLGCFMLLPGAYAAVHQRMRDGGGWALAGLGWILIFLAAEVMIRSLEFIVVASWQREWLATSSGPEQARLGTWVAGFGQGVSALYLPLLAAHALASGAFALGLRGRDRWSRLARAGFALNCLRATVRLGAMHLGQDWLAPVADALYLPLTLFHSLAVSVWLALPGPALSLSPGRAPVEA